MNTQTPADFSIIAIEHARFGSCLNVTITSPLLDRAMHRNGSLLIGLPGNAVNVGAKQFRLDSFMADSLDEYLKKQSDIREMIEQAMVDHLRPMDPENKLGRGAAIWKFVQVATIAILPRETKVQSREARRLGLLRIVRNAASKPILDEILDTQEMLSTANARTALDMILDIDVENDDHAHIAHFRNGKLVKLYADG